MPCAKPALREGLTQARARAIGRASCPVGTWGTPELRSRCGGPAGLAVRVKDDTGLQFVLWWDDREK